MVLAGPQAPVCCQPCPDSSALEDKTWRVLLGYLGLSTGTQRPDYIDGTLVRPHLRGSTENLACVRFQGIELFLLSENTRFIRICSTKRRDTIDHQSVVLNYFCDYHIHRIQCICWIQSGVGALVPSGDCMRGTPCR